MSQSSMPPMALLVRATLDALTSFDGKATNSQINQWVQANLNFTESQLSQMHSPNRTEIEYRLAWARTKASKKGLIKRCAPSTWEII